MKAQIVILSILIIGAISLFVYDQNEKKEFAKRKMEVFSNMMKSIERNDSLTRIQLRSLDEERYHMDSLAVSRGHAKVAIRQHTQFKSNWKPSEYWSHNNY